jgi:hypothetical protein
MENRELNRSLRLSWGTMDRQAKELDRVLAIYKSGDAEEIARLEQEYDYLI